MELKPVLCASSGREIGREAFWTPTSSRFRYGVENLYDNNLNTYWQSDGIQPHAINLRFLKKTTINEIAFYIDHQMDESYTPQQIAVKAGSTLQDLEQVGVLVLNEPQGWQTLPLKRTNGGNEETPLRTYLLQILIVSMHQNGRDTHIRQVKVYAPKAAPMNLNEAHYYNKVLERERRTQKERKRRLTKYNNKEEKENEHEETTKEEKGWFINASSPEFTMYSTIR